MNPLMHRKTWEQLQCVLQKMQVRYRRGDSIKDAYLAATEAVARNYGIRVPTINDACCRRLGLDTDGFRAYVTEWLDGNPFRLAQTIKLHTPADFHQDIDTFLESDGKSTEPVGKDPHDIETLHVQFAKETIIQIRTVAELEGMGIERWIQELVIKTVKPLFFERLIVIVSNMTDEERGKLLRCMSKNFSPD